MHSIIRSLAVVALAVATLALPASAQSRSSKCDRNAVVAPPQAELAKFPVMCGTVKAVADSMEKYGLHYKRLDTAWTGFNWYGNVNGRGGRFVYETLAKGTLVLADKDGAVRYKASCFNRLVELGKCPFCAGTALFQNGGSLRLGGANGLGSSGSPQADTRGPIHRLADALRDAAKAVWGTAMWQGVGNGIRGLFWLAMLILGILLLPLLLYGLYRLFRNSGTSSSASASATAVPPVARPVASAPVATPPGYTPVGTRQAPVMAAAVPVATPAAVADVGGGASAPAPTSASASAAAPAAAQAAAPAEPRRMVSFAAAGRGQPNMLRFEGVDNVSFERLDGVTTIRFRDV